MVIVEWTAHENTLPAPDGRTESQLLRYLSDGDLPGSLHNLSKSVGPGMSLSALALANKMVARDSRAARTAATGDWFVGVERARFRELS